MRVILLVLIVILVAACSGQAAKQVTGTDVVAAFKAAGLEAETPYEMQIKDYGPAPFVCKGTRFIIPSLGKTASGDTQGGRVFICDNADDMKRLQDYYTNLAKGSAVFFSHMYTKGPVLVQINGTLDKALADKYGAAIP